MRFRLCLSLDTSEILDVMAHAELEETDEGRRLAFVSWETDKVLGDWRVPVSSLIGLRHRLAITKGSRLGLLAGCFASWPVRTCRNETGQRRIEIETEPGIWLDLSGLPLSDLITGEQELSLRPLDN